MNIEISFEADHLVRVLEAVRRAGENHATLLGAIGETLFKANTERHMQGVGPDGTPWEPLAASTLAAGPRKGGPLNRTGRMLDHAFYPQVDGDTLRLGFNGGDGFPAIFHQDGSRAHVIAATKAKALSFGGIVRKKVSHPGLPARPLVGFPDSDADLVAEECTDYLQITLDRARQR